MSVLIIALAYALFGVALPAGFWAVVLWLAPKTPGYRRRVFGEGQ
ncbi:hypothetical protein SAMN05216199_1262 [Pedococcus cremeus]|uniref:Uncharacterized protein n=1 Tax=Pedococcus cremeus TaxID=587636 RepID=A0A1H9S517_9MICO|nr:hypothetical protein [Pedococcus cremeus]SER80087.1 hypothetical protein SAMN05216199_1262 [Pedococcus cremeus]